MSHLRKTNLFHPSHWLLLVGVIGAPQVSAEEIQLSPQNMGPLKKAKAGDTVWFEAGVYAKPVEMQGLQGTADKPITVAAAKGGKVILDGTDRLPDDWKLVTPNTAEGKLIQPAQWRRMQGKLYCLKLDKPIHALVYEGRLMSDARWPDARWDDPWRLDRYVVLRRATEQSIKGQLHDGLPTDNTLEESSRWIHYDRSQLHHRQEMLGDTGVSFRGAVAVLSHTWGSWGTRITEHKVGSDRLKYDTTFEGSGSIKDEADGFLNNRIGWPEAASRFKTSGHGGIHFFLMGLPALDIEKEWWYHQPTKTLYFMPPSGEKPDAGKARGKRRDYQLMAKNCQHLHIKGFEFFGGAASLEGCEESRMEDCHFRYAAMHKFSVGNFDMPVTTRIINAQGDQDEDKLYGNAVLNCQFTYQDGNALEGRSAGLMIDNVLIYRTQQTTLGLDSRSMSIDRPSLVRRVTIDDVGASVGIKGGGIDSIYELNNIARFGGLQYDGASLQMGGRDKVIYRFNWSHDHPKRSFRFDAGSYPDFANAFGEMSYNVAWNTPGGFAIKGDDHLIHNNILIGDSGFELFNMKRWASKNERTLVANNIVPLMTAGSYDWDQPVVRKRTTSSTPESSDTYWLTETVVPESHPISIGKDGPALHDDSKRGRRKSPLLAIRKNNCFEDAHDVLRDPANLDFRLKEGSKLIDGGYAITQREVPWKEVPITGQETWNGNAPDVGAYESESEYYWIPGFKFPHASTPVPPNGTTTAKRNCSLMWLGGYKATQHHLYCGPSKPEVAQADRNDRLYCGVFEGERNVYSLETDLKPGVTLYWRVDAVREGMLIKGKVWNFTVER